VTDNRAQSLVVICLTVFKLLWVLNEDCQLRRNLGEGCVADARSVSLLSRNSLVSQKCVHLRWHWGVNVYLGLVQIFSIFLTLPLRKLKFLMPNVADHSSRGVLSSVVCLSMIVKPRKWGRGSLEAVGPWKEKGSILPPPFLPPSSIIS